METKEHVLAAYSYLQSRYPARTMILRVALLGRLEYAMAVFVSFTSEPVVLQF